MNKIFLGDTFFPILKHLNYKDLEQLCELDKNINEFCNKKEKEIWNYMLNRDFPIRSKGKGLNKINRKHLYYILIQKSKIIKIEKEDAPNVFALFPSRVKDEETNDEENYGSLYNGSVNEYAMNVLQADIDNLIENDKVILAGDIIYFSWVIGYRNCGKFIWNGKHILELDSEIDEYGSVPSNFRFPEYPLNHFHDSITHNYIIWLTKPIIQEIINNYNEETSSSYIYDKNEKYVLDFIFEVEENNISKREKREKIVEILNKEYIDSEFHNNNFLIFISE